MLRDTEFLILHKILLQYRTDPSMPNGKLATIFLDSSIPIDVFRVRRPNQDLFIADVVGTPIKVLTQNLLKPSENTRWIMEDPEHRGVSWLTHGRDSYLGECRTYLNERNQLTHSVTMF